MPGEVGTKAIPRSEKKFSRSQWLILIISSSTFNCFESFQYEASSAVVQLCRTGMRHLPMNELQFTSSSIGPSALNKFPLIGFGLSSINKGLSKLLHDSII